MICKVNNLFKTILLLFYFVTIILGDCTIKYNNNPLNKPQFGKKIGRRIIQISNNNDYITLLNNQEIIAFCEMQFKEPESYKLSKELKLRCEVNGDVSINGNLFHVYNRNRHGYGYSQNQLYLECASIKWNLYDLSEPFDWCPANMASYILARPHEAEIYQYRSLAGICYDIYNMTLNSIYYTMAPMQQKYLHPSTLTTNHFTQNEEIKYVKETFKPKSVFAQNYDNKQFQHWMELTNYQYKSIIQNPNLYSEVFNELGSMLDFQWWPNLRLNNWHLYEEALAKHIEKEKMAYDILAGISGVVMAPIRQACENNYTMRNFVDSANNTRPLYVWNYLQPSFANEGIQRNKDIVVIGFNSPFNEFYAKSDIVFCQDICHEIDWLKNVRSTFRYSTMGIVFCCSVDEVRSSKRLDNFPQYMTKSVPKLIQQTTTTPPEIPHFYETTTQIYNVDDENHESTKYFGYAKEDYDLTDFLE